VGDACGMGSGRGHKRAIASRRTLSSCRDPGQKCSSPPDVNKTQGHLRTSRAAS
jgi:hypothetical protein